MIKNKIKGVIFDLDNTLVSSTLNFNEIRAALACPSDTNILQYVDSLPVAEQQSAIQMIIGYEIKDAEVASNLTGTEDLLNLAYHVPS